MASSSTKTATRQKNRGQTGARIPPQIRAKARRLIEAASEDYWRGRCRRCAVSFSECQCICEECGHAHAILEVRR